MIFALPLLLIELLCTASPGQAPAQSNSYYALVIGINRYQAPLPALQTAVNDAEAMAQVLSERYGFQVKLLLDGDATRDNILSAMDLYRRTLHDKDSLLIYYAGHGYADKEEDKAYWIPVDAERNTRSRWIIADELTSRMRSDPARHVLVISDSCYSGGLLRDAGIEVRAADQRMYLSKMMASRSRTLMSSGGNEPVSDLGGDGHSVFANTVLKALKGTEAKEFTAGDLFHDYVLRQVAGNADQIPKYASIRNSGDDAGDFVFVRDEDKGSIERVRMSTTLANTNAGFEPARGTRSTLITITGMAMAKYKVNDCRSLPRTNTKDFESRDSSAWFFFTYTGGTAGGHGQINWVGPDGSVYGTSTWTQAITGGFSSYCYYQKVDGYLGNFPGNWSAQIWWNGVEVTRYAFVISRE